MSVQVTEQQVADVVDVVSTGLKLIDDAQMGRVPSTAEIAALRPRLEAILTTAKAVGPQTVRVSFDITDFPGSLIAVLKDEIAAHDIEQALGDGIQGHDDDLDHWLEDNEFNVQNVTVEIVSG